MDVRLFNRNRTTKKPNCHNIAATNQRREAKKAAADHGLALGDTIEYESWLLDPGFEDLGVRIVDFKVAPGVMGHFDLAPSSQDFVSMPQLEVA